ncbi:MAG: isoleucine--tRNA ligase [Candidatus Kariarchaeaceae archaeon]
MVRLEESVLQFWNELDLHQQLMEKNTGNPPFSFFDGPITANNPMGVHHAWGRTYKDVVQRYKAMMGFDQRYQNGFDTQGLWLEVEVEKSLGLKSKKDIETYGLENFAEACKARVAKFSKKQTEQSKRLGQTMDWVNSYYTHTDENVSAIWHFLKVCHEKGWLYRGVQPMPWCWRCGTSLSNHEQSDSYKLMTHKSPYVKFKLVDKEAYLLVWTTTPWTLTANQAVAVRPDLTYGLFLTPSGETVVAGMWLASTLLSNCTLLTEVAGTDLEGMEYETPYEHLKQQPKGYRKVYLWDEVSDSEGTGLVHLAPGCGAEDYKFGLENELAVVSPVNEAGEFSMGFGPFSKKHYSRVNEKVLEDLGHRDLMFALEDYTHKYPSCWRCKEELVFRLVDEWFLSCDEVRPLMLEAADTVEWVPSHVGKLFKDWLHNMGDWCVSRKRYWGLPLPFYECSCGHLNVLGSKQELQERAVGDFSKVKELHRPWVDEVQVKCEVCGNPVDRVTEVGDCWLDAGVMPFSTVQYFTDRDYWIKWFPAEYVCEMREQTRLWFYSLMFMSVTLVGQAPYRKVASHEKVHDSEGKPMHKSTGNAVWFDDAVNSVGADALRLYYLSQNPATMMRFSVEDGKSFSKPVMQVWNVLKFFTSLADVDGFQMSDMMSSHPLDLWVFSELDATVQEFHTYLDKLDFRSLYQSLERFLDNLSGWYVRRSRKRFWSTSWTEDKTSAMNTLYQVLLTTSKLVAPLTPFLAEVVFQSLKAYGSDLEPSVHLSDYPTTTSRFDPDLSEEMDQVRDLVSMTLRLRSTNGLRVRQPLNKMLVWSSHPGFSELLKKYRSELMDELNVKAVTLLDRVDNHLEHTLKPRYDLLGPRLGKSVDKLQSELDALSSQEVLQWLLSEKDRLQVNGFSLSKDEVEVRSTPKEGFDALSEGSVVVFLETNVTPELEDEGLARDFVRYVQMARKDLNLDLNSQVGLQLHVPDEYWTVLQKHQDFVWKETQTTDWENVSLVGLPNLKKFKFRSNSDMEVQFVVNQ